MIVHSLLCIVWGLFDWELGRNIYRLIWPSFMQVCEGFARKSCKSCQVGISHDRPPHMTYPTPIYWQIKLLSEFFSQFTFKILQVTLTQKIITHRVLKLMNGFEGMCMSNEKFLKPSQVTHKIIEWIFMQFTFNFLWVTLTQKIITHRLSKIHEWIRGDVYE